MEFFKNSVYSDYISVSDKLLPKVQRKIHQDILKQQQAISAKYFPKADELWKDKKIYITSNTVKDNNFRLHWDAYRKEHNKTFINHEESYLTYHTLPIMIDIVEIENMTINPKILDFWCKYSQHTLYKNTSFIPPTVFDPKYLIGTRPSLLCITNNWGVFMQDQNGRIALTNINSLSSHSDYIIVYCTKTKQILKVYENIDDFETYLKEWIEFKFNVVKTRLHCSYIQYEQHRHEMSFLQYTMYINNGW
jgi:hypothetical protein